MKYLLLSLFMLVLLMPAAKAQPTTGTLDIQLNKNVLLPGDSLSVTVHYSNGVTPIPKPSLATLELIVENEEGQRTRLRWPFIKGLASGVLYLPDSIPHGRYTILAGLQQRFFEVTGQVQNSRSNGMIQAMLLTKNGEWDEQEVPLAQNGTFTIRNWLFEDNALLAFSAGNNNKQTLDIRISTRLDSTNAPLAVAGKVFYVGNPSAAQQQALQQPVETPEAIFIDQAKLLPAVFIQTVLKTRAQQFDQEYVSALFKSGNERTLSIMDDPSAIGQPNILSYLQGRVAGLQISQVGFNGGSASWRGDPVTFFMDEMRVSAQQIAGIPMSDIAIVKAYPPPFFAAPGGGAGGGIAIYTRRGGEAGYLPANRQVFRVRGYTPEVTVLDMDKLLL